jgi:RHS repeat-associated protein
MSCPREIHSAVVRPGLVLRFERGIVGNSGTLSGTTSYDAWGNTHTSGGLSAYTPFGFSGGYTDPTGLIYLLNRYYDPSVGQFVSMDPALQQTAIPYAYAADNPVNNVDPTGESNEPVIRPGNNIKMPFNDFNIYTMCKGSWHGICYMLLGARWSKNLLNAMKWSAVPAEACIEFSERILGFGYEIASQILTLFCIGLIGNEIFAEHLENKIAACETMAFFVVNLTQYEGAAGIVFALDYLQPLSFLGIRGKLFTPRGTGCWWWHPLSSGFLV